MYSLTAVGGIQYTTEMAKNNKMKKSNKQMMSRDTMRTTIRDLLVLGVSGAPGTSVLSIATDATGNYNDQFFLSPLGLTAASLSATTWSNGTANNVEKPHLRKLYNLAGDFRQFRVLGGRLTWIPNCSTTTPGLITMSSSSDPFDMVTATAVAYSGGPSYKTFNLSAGKECSIPLSVDPSWKKVTSVLSCPMGPVFDGSGTATNVVVNVATLQDLCFTALGVNVTGTGGVVAVGTFRVELDVEFKGIIDLAANA